MDAGDRTYQGCATEIGEVETLTEDLYSATSQNSQKTTFFIDIFIDRRTELLPSMFNQGN
jgi:hypothetical protein